MSERRSKARTVKVLVVDDNVDAAHTLAYLLRLHGCKTAVAFGGETAIRTAELLQPHLAIIDLLLPGLDGYEVLRRMRAQNARPLLAVALTGHWTSDCQHRSREAGFDLFVEKPMPPAMVGELLSECYERMRKPGQAAMSRQMPVQRAAD